MVDLKNMGPSQSGGMPSPYSTPLNFGEQLKFEMFKIAQGIPDDGGKFNSTYDMQGFFKKMLQQGGTAFQSPTDGATADLPDGLHFTDEFKTPFHPTFSNESKYKMPGLDRDWTPNGDGTWSLIDNKTGAVIRDERSAFTFPGLLRG
mgnify:CR=1 FL=1|tara:strand:+ start:821 stop:1261 length:441 start_codon:yes stop_codon:yes gene_type:complete